MWTRLIETLCKRITRWRPYRVFYRPDGGPYLIRHYLLGERDHDHSARRPRLASRLPYCPFLHLILSSDVEPQLHCHPWERSVSVILTGGYREERRVGNDVVTRVLRPGSINVIGSKDYHRIELLTDHCWTLFFAGKRTRDGHWYFWDRKTCESIHWREQVYVRRKVHAVA